MTNPIDGLLRDWSSRMAGDSKSLAGLERKITMKMRETRYAYTETKAFSMWGRLAWFSLGAVTAFAIAMVFVRLPSEGNSTHVPELARTSESVHRLFKEVDRLFAGNLRWIAQSDGNVELGIDPDSGKSESGEQTFAVHIAVVARNDDESTWKKVWESDILTWGEQSIDVAPDENRDNRVALWIYPVADGRFAVDSRVTLNAPVRIYSDSSDVVEDGKPTAVTVMTIGPREYRVYQTVTRLKAKKDGPC